MERKSFSIIYLFRIGKADKTLYVFGDKHFWKRQRNNIAHPHIEMTSVLNTWRSIRNLLAIMPSNGIKPQSLSCYREILAWESACDDINSIWKHITHIHKRLCFFYKIDYASDFIHVRRRPTP